MPKQARRHDLIQSDHVALMQKTGEGGDVAAFFPPLPGSSSAYQRFP
jgi:hypothetical protein